MFSSCFHVLICFIVFSFPFCVFSFLCRWFIVPFSFFSFFFHVYLHVFSCCFVSHLRLRFRHHAFTFRFFISFVRPLSANPNLSGFVLVELLLVCVIIGLELSLYIEDKKQPNEKIIN